MRFELKNEAPWLKIWMLIIMICLIIVGFKGMFRRNVGDTGAGSPEAPMKIHAEVPEKVFRRSVEGKKLVALTFDDGPEVETTGKLLDILKEKETVATFFELGVKVERNSEITRRAKNEGHEVESHTMYHQNLVTKTREEAESDIRAAKEVFLRVLGEEPKLTRMPYGNSNEFTKAAAGTPLIYWSVDSRDWESKDAEKIQEVIFATVKDGAIILMHDIYNTTVDAVPEVIDGLRAEGYEFVTVEELAGLRGKELQAQETYFSFEATGEI